MAGVVRLATAGYLLDVANRPLEIRYPPLARKMRLVEGLRQGRKLVTSLNSIDTSVSPSLLK